MGLGVTVGVVFPEVRLSEAVFDTDSALTRKRLVVAEADFVAVQDRKAEAVAVSPSVVVGGVRVAAGKC